MITSSFPRYEGDYFGPWILDYARALASENTKVIVVAPNVRDIPHSISEHKNLQIEKFNYWWPLKYQRLVHPPGMIPQIKKNPFRILQIPFLLLGYIRMANKIIKREAIDLIHCQWLIPSGFIGAIIKQFYNIPLYVTSQGAELFLPLHHPYSIFTKWTIRKANKIFPVSEQMAKKLISFGCRNDKIVIIPNSVDTTKFKPLKDNQFRNTYAIPHYKTLILTVRRLVKEKRVEDLINSFAKLAKGKNAQLVIAGDGPERNYLEHLTKQYNIENEIIFLGNVNNEDLPNIYDASDIYVLSSQQEGLSLSLLEAMSTGTIVISTKSTGGTDLIQHNLNGFLYEIGNTSQLTNILNYVLDLNQEQSIKIKTNSRNTILEKFSVQYMIESWQNNYRS